MTSRASKRGAERLIIRSDTPPTQLPLPPPRRFALSPATYSPQRHDAANFSMDGPEAREGLLNVTDLQTCAFDLGSSCLLDWVGWRGLTL